MSVHIDIAPTDNHKPDRLLDAQSVLEWLCRNGIDALLDMPFSAIRRIVEGIRLAFRGGSERVPAQVIELDVQGVRRQRRIEAMQEPAIQRGKDIRRRHHPVAGGAPQCVVEELHSQIGNLREFDLDILHALTGLGSRDGLRGDLRVVL